MTELVEQEKNRMSEALARLEDAIEKYTRHSEGKAVTAATKDTQSQIDSLQDQVRSLEDQVARKNEEVSHLSADVVRYKSEVTKLRELNRRTATMLGNSIKEIEELVS
jgi:peptidoglycan hydrolase CwlO-like protein